MAGNAALQAARKMRDLLVAAVSTHLEVDPDDLVVGDHRIHPAGAPARGVSFQEAAGLAEALFGTLVTVGSYRPPHLAGPYKGSGVGPSPAYSFTAAVVEVRVDPETGEVRVERVWIAHDIGRPINETLVVGQIEGSVYMALGEALMEEQVFRKGLHKIPSMLEYKSPTVLEMPPVETILVITDDPEGPFGAKEAGQGPLLPVIPAVANAVYDAVGVRIDEVPITPDKVLAALEQKAKGGEGRRGPAGVPAFPFRAPIKVEPPLWVERPLAFPRSRVRRGGGAGRRPAPGGCAGRARRAVMLRLPPFTYLAPRTVEEAVRSVREAGPDAVLVAGGTDLFPNMKRRQIEPKTVVGLRGIPDLGGSPGTPGGGWRSA